MIPHIVFAFGPAEAGHYSFLDFLLLLLDPTLDVPLLARAHRERARRDVFPDCRSTPYVGAFTDRDRRDELRIGADEHAVLDRRLVLAAAVVIARDRAGAYVDVVANHRVAEIGVMASLGSLAQYRLLQLDEVADVYRISELCLRPYVDEGPDGHA